MEEQLFKSGLKDLQKILAEEGLTAVFDGSYPMKLIVKPAPDEIDGQMDMMTAAEVADSFAQPDVKIVLRYIADDVQLEITGRMTMEDDLYRKIRSKFKSACVYFMAWIHRMAMDNEILSRTKYGGDDE